MMIASLCINIACSWSLVCDLPDSRVSGQFASINCLDEGSRGKDDRSPMRMMEIIVAGNGSHRDVCLDVFADSLKGLADNRSQKASGERKMWGIGCEDFAMPVIADTAAYAITNPNTIHANGHSNGCQILRW